MIEAVSAAMPHAFAPQPTQTETMRAEALVDTAAVQKPDKTMVADFSNSVASSSQPPRPEAPAAPSRYSVDAAAPAGEADIAKRISEQANSLAEHLKSMDPRAGTSAPKSAADSHRMAPTRADPAVTDGDKTAPKDKDKPHITDADRAAVDANIAQMEHAYVFAIEATLASRGSTEATKIFNTLLKGQ